MVRLLLGLLLVFLFWPALLILPILVLVLGPLLLACFAVCAVVALLVLPLKLFFACMCG